MEKAFAKWPESPPRKKRPAEAPEPPKYKYGHLPKPPSSRPSALSTERKVEDHEAIATLLTKDDPEAAQAVEAMRRRIATKALEIVSLRMDQISHQIELLEHLHTEDVYEHTSATLLMTHVQAMRGIVEDFRLRGN